MAEEQQIRESESERETPKEVVKDTGVLVYHIPTKLKCEIKAKVKRGSGKIFVNGVLIVDLIENGRIRRIEELLRVMSRERLKALDIDLDLGDALSSDAFSPSILAYAITEALTNLLGRL